MAVKLIRYLNISAYISVAIDNACISMFVEGI